MREAARSRGDDPDERPHRNAVWIDTLVGHEPVAEALLSERIRRASGPTVPDRGERGAQRRHRGAA
jgi:hypothetical protein